MGCVVNCDVSTRSTVGCDVLGWRLNGFSHRWFYSGEDYPWGKTTQVTGDKHRVMIKLYLELIFFYKREKGSEGRWKLSNFGEIL